MPELPEVEVTRRSLVGRMDGAQIKAVRLGKPLRWPVGREPEALVGCCVGAVSRRGKYLWLPLTRRVNGLPRDEGGLLIHLGMSGSLYFGDDWGEAGKHDHFVLDTDRGRLRLTDPRRFGAVIWGERLDEGMPGKLLAKLGHEPFEAGLTGEVLWTAWRGRSVGVKQALMAGDVVVGAGNIYACEALFRAGIHPGLAAGKLSRLRCQRLLGEVQGVLSMAIDMGGSSLKDFKDAHGAQGHFQTSTLVYGREGQPCRACGAPIKRTVQGQRATYFCQSCQKK